MEISGSSWIYSARDKTMGIWGLQRERRQIKLWNAMSYNKWRKAMKAGQEVGRELEKNDVKMEGTEFLSKR